MDDEDEAPWEDGGVTQHGIAASLSTAPHTPLWKV